MLEKTADAATFWRRHFQPLKRYGLTETDVRKAGRILVIEGWRFSAMWFAVILAAGVVSGIVVRRLGIEQEMEGDDWPVSGQVTLLIISLACAFLIQRYRRRRIPYALLSDLKWATNQLHTLLDQPTGPRFYAMTNGNGRLRYYARFRLRLAAWRITGCLALLSGYRYSERTQTQVDLYGRWLCWVTDHVDDRRRVDQALEITADLTSWVLRADNPMPPRLVHPPNDAVLHKPIRLERLASNFDRAWPVLAALVASLAAAATVARLFL